MADKHPALRPYGPALQPAPGMPVEEWVTQAAVRHFLAILPLSGEDGAPHRALLSIRLGDEVKPLLLVGTANSRVEDGSCYAILNPDQALADVLHGGVGYTPQILRHMVKGRCDLAMSVWIEAYQNDRVVAHRCYKARQPQPARFQVQ